MKFRMLSAALFLPASLLAITGCTGPVTSDGAAGEDDVDDAEDVTAESEDAWGSGSWQWYGDVPNVYSPYTPSLTAANNYMYMVHGGVGTSQVYYNRYDGRNWLGSQPIPNAYARFAPSALYHNNQLHVMYSDGTTPYHTYYAGGQWSMPAAIARVHGAVTPMLAGYGNKLYMAYNDPGSCGYYVAEYGCGAQQTSGCGWQQPTQVPNACGLGAPGIAPYQNQLYMAYRGIGANDLYYMAWNGRTWGNPAQISGYAGYGSPTLAASRNGLYLSYYNSANQLHWGSFSRGGWGAAALLNQTTAYPVGFTGFRGSLYMSGVGYNGSNVFWGGYGGNYGRGWY